VPRVGSVRTVELFYAPEGQRPSSWIGSAEFEEVARLLSQSNCVSTADANGFTAEFSFGERDTSMLMVQTDQRHPQLGNGLLLRLHLYHAHGIDNAPFTAAMLNTLEMRLVTRAHLIGSWSSTQLSSKSDIPVFVTFIPNALHRRGLLLNLVMSMGLRARWAAVEVQGQSKEWNVKDTFERRLSKVFSWLRRN
jgi:hypothetical protein